MKIKIIKDILKKSYNLELKLKVGFQKGGRRRRREKRKMNEEFIWLGMRKKI